MSNRISFALAVLLLLGGGFLRLVQLPGLPVGLHEGEILNIRIAETVRSGSVEIFYDLGGQGREGLYHFGLTFTTAFSGKGPLGYRMLSIWTGLLTLAAVYALGRRLFGHIAGLGAMATLTVGFWPVLLSRQIIPEAVIPLLLLTVLLCLTLTLPLYRRRRWRSDHTSAATVLGVCLGLMLYVHPVGVVMVLFTLLFIAYMIASPLYRLSRRRIGYIGFAVLLLMIISMPYVISTLRRPELSGLDRLISREGFGLLTPIHSLGGLFFSGDASALYNLPGRPMFDPLSALLIVLGVGVALRHWKQAPYSLLLVLALVLSPVYLLAASSPNFLNYVPMLPVLALFFGIGLAQLRALPFGRFISVLLLVGLVGYNAQSTYDDLFRRWPQDQAVQAAYNSNLGQLAQYIDRRANDTPLVLCGWAASQSPDAMQLTEAQIIGLMRNHKGAPIRQVDCYNALVMTNGGADQQVIFPSTHALEHAHPQIMQWLTYGDLLNIADVPSYTIIQMDVERPLADRLGRITLENPLQYAPETNPLPNETVYAPVSFGGNITFLGYIPEASTTYKPGATVTLTTYWRVDGLVPSDLVIFSHILVDPDASPLANRDVINLDPRQLRNRDVFVQVTEIVLPEGIPPGEYALSVGIYQETSGERLPVQENGQVTGDRLFLYDITIQDQEA